MVFCTVDGLHFFFFCCCLGCIVLSIILSKSSEDKYVQYLVCLLFISLLVSYGWSVLNDEHAFLICMKVWVSYIIK